MDKHFIISEIKRTALANGGEPLGSQRFERETIVRRSDWYGKHWKSWGDALVEAGYSRNEFQGAYDESYLLIRLIELIREIERFPVEGDIRIKARKDKSFPSHSGFARLGNKTERVRRVIEYCSARSEFADVLQFCPSTPDEVPAVQQRESKGCEIVGFVYLLRSGHHCKIGRSNAVGRRERELAIQLPQRAEAVHTISTDDPAGIEAYWHNRFKDKRKNGEWFELSAEDVRAFKRRKFQ